jgi:hypothetical protein
MMEIIWIVISVILVVVCLWKSYTLGFRLGYKTGAERVLNEWKQAIRGMGDDEI